MPDDSQEADLSLFQFAYFCALLVAYLLLFKLLFDTAYIAFLIERQDGEQPPRISLKRLGYDLVEADAGKRMTREPHFYIRHEGSRVHATSDLFGLSLVGVEQWIREQMQAP